MTAEVHENPMQDRLQRLTIEAQRLVQRMKEQRERDPPVSLQASPSSPRRKSHVCLVPETLAGGEAVIYVRIHNAQSRPRLGADLEPPSRVADSAPASEARMGSRHLVRAVRTLLDNAEAAIVYPYGRQAPHAERSERSTPATRNPEATASSPGQASPKTAGLQTSDAGIEGECGGGGAGGGGSGGDGDDDGGGDDDDDDHGMGPGASPIPRLRVALLILGIISLLDPTAMRAAQPSQAPERPARSPNAILDVDIRATLAEFEGLLATFPDLSAVKIDERGTWAQWMIAPRNRHSSPLGYVTAHELQGITTLRFFELLEHSASSRDGPCHRLAQRVIDALPQRCLLHTGPHLEAGDHGYNLAAVRGLLLAAFDAKDLRSFVYYLPQFRPIVDSFGPDHGFTDMVDQVIGYCERHCLLDELLREVEIHNPAQYRRWAPHLQAVATDD